MVAESHRDHLVTPTRGPEGVDESKVTATYKDGDLEFRMPMPAEKVATSTMKIPVTRGRDTFTSRRHPRRRLVVPRGAETYFVLRRRRCRDKAGPIGGP